MKNSPAGAWLSQIETARSGAELVRLMRDYVAGLSAEERAQLPPDCAWDNLNAPADLQECAVTLAHGDLKAIGSAETTDALRQAAVVFAAAAAKLTKVAG